MSAIRTTPEGVIKYLPTLHGVSFNVYGKA